MLFDCANCNQKMAKTFRDKVSNRLVCERCMLHAIELGIRFDFDFEDLH